MNANTYKRWNLPYGVRFAGPEATISSDTKIGWRPLGSWIWDPKSRKIRAT